MLSFNGVVGKWTLILCLSVVPLITAIVLAAVDQRAYKDFGFAIQRVGFFRSCVSGESVKDECIRITDSEPCGSFKILSWFGAFSMWFQCLFGLVAVINCWAMRSAAKSRIEDGFADAGIHISLSTPKNFFRFLIFLSAFTFGFAMGMFYGRRICPKAKQSLSQAGYSWGPTIYVQFAIVPFYIVLLCIMSKFRDELSEAPPVSLPVVLLGIGNNMMHTAMTTNAAGQPLVSVSMPGQGTFATIPLHTQPGKPPQFQVTQQQQQQQAMFSQQQGYGGVGTGGFGGSGMNQQQRY